jgi:hypothetical protein
MERVVRRLGASGLSGLVNTGVLVAIFGFGAPPWILIPVNLAGVTLYMEIDSRMRRRSGQY